MSDGCVKGSSQEPDPLEGDGLVSSANVVLPSSPDQTQPGPQGHQALLSTSVQVPRLCVRCQRAALELVG